MSTTLEAPAGNSAGNHAEFENHIPAAIRRQAARADELVRAVYTPPAEGDGTTLPTTVVENLGQTVPPNGQTELPLEGGGGASVQTQPESWEQRYNTLQGKYNTETNQLRVQLRGAEARNASLEGLLAVVKADPAPTPTTRAAPVVSPEDVEAYGQELIEKSRAWARAEIEPELAQLRQDVAQVRGQSQQHAMMTATDRMNAALDSGVPNWRTVNASSDFHNWLAQDDEFSGKSRQTLVTEAYHAGNASRVIAFFKAFEHTVAPAGAVPASHTPALAQPDGGAGKVDLASLVAPGRGRSVAPGAQGEKRIYRQHEITALYDLKKLGRISHEEFTRREKDLHQAITEGRITA